MAVSTRTKKKTIIQANTITHYLKPRATAPGKIPKPSSLPLSRLTSLDSCPPPQPKKANTPGPDKVVHTKPSTRSATRHPSSSPLNSLQLASPLSTVLGLPSSTSPSLEDEEVLSQLIPHHNSQTKKKDSKQTASHSKKKAHTALADPPQRAPTIATPSTSPASQLVPSPSASTILPIPAFPAADLDELDLEDEWLTKALEVKSNSMTKCNPTPIANTNPNPSSSAQRTRRSEKLNKPHSGLVDSSAPPRSSTIPNLRSIQPLSSTSKIPDKFSLNSILKDNQLRQQRQANLVKRKREEFDHFDLNQLPDQLHPDSIQVTPKKKKNLNQQQPDQQKNKKNATKSTAKNLNMNIDNDDHEYLDRNPSDMITSPSKLELLKENITLLKQPNLAVKNGLEAKTYSRAGGVCRLIEQDIASGQLAGLNRGLEFRQVFKKTVAEPCASSSPRIVEPATISFEESYHNRIGVSLDPNILDFVHEIIDNLNYSIRYPDFLSIDLVNLIPAELKTRITSKESGKAPSFQCEDVNNTHQAILKILFKPIVDPQFSSQVAEKSTSLINSYLKNLNSDTASSSGDYHVGNGSMPEFWLETLQNSLIKLGVLDRLVYFGEYTRNGQHAEGRAKEDENDVGLDFDFRIERIRCILSLFHSLSTSNQLNERGRRWAFTISIRLGIEPSSSFKLRTEIVIYTSSVLDRMITPSALVNPSNKSERDNRMMKKEEIIKLVTEVLTVGLDVHTWTNILELVRLIPNRFQFRKFLVIGLLDLVVLHANMNHHGDITPRSSERFESVLHKMARWLTHISNKFLNPPPAREIYNTIRKVSKRPYEEVEHDEMEKKGDGKEGQAEGGKEGTELEEGVQLGDEKQTKETAGNEEGIHKEMQKKTTITGRNHRDKFREAFESYLGETEDEEGRRKPRMNEIQFKDLIELFQISLMGVWDYLIDGQNRDQVKTSGYNHHNSNSSDLNGSPSTSASTTTSGNVWIKLIQQSLESLDSKITSNTSPQFKADRIKLKNAIYRLSSCLDFLNQESFLFIKGIDSKGQIKLDKFFTKKDTPNQQQRITRRRN